MSDINKLIGIPFRLNRKDLKGCDCRGIVYLYYKYIKEKEIPFSDGKRIFFRNIKKDKDRIIDILKTFAQPVSYMELKEGDIVVINNIGNTGALGVCINNKQLLHMDQVVGSCLTKLRYLKDFFLIGYRPNA
jgi:hypothetical protein